jgi:HD domain-containing protein
LILDLQFAIEKTTSKTKSHNLRSKSKIKNRKSRMLGVLIELQRLKNLDRTGWTLRGLLPGTESVASHSFGVAVTAMMLADELAEQGVTIDLERLLRMAVARLGRSSCW